MEITPQLYRKVLSHFATGVTVATTTLEGEPYGMTVSAFCSLSLDPLLVLICIDHSASLHDQLVRSRRYAVNFLGEEHEQVSRHFARSDRPRGAAGFGPAPFHFEASGSPVLDDAVAFVDCDVEAIYPGGDHSIFVGQVRAVGMREGNRPLIYWYSGYRRLVGSEPG